MSEAKPTYAALNETFFDEEAQKYDDVPQNAERARRTAVAMRKHFDFHEEHTTVLDYACGTGHLSRELAPYAKSIVGVDISQGMVDQYNKRVSDQGIPPEEMKAVRAHLKGIEGELGNAKFDVVVCASSYHHFDSIEEVTKTLVYFLKPGGLLIVVDLLKDDGARGQVEHHNHHDHHDHHAPEAEGVNPEVVAVAKHTHTVAHPGGFTEDVIRAVFEGAGLTSFSFSTAITAIFHGRNATLFIAKGTKSQMEVAR